MNKQLVNRGSWVVLVLIIVVQIIPGQSVNANASVQSIEVNQLAETFYSQLNTVDNRVAAQPIIENFFCSLSNYCYLDEVQLKHLLSTIYLDKHEIVYGNVSHVSFLEPVGVVLFKLERMWLSQPVRGFVIENLNALICRLIFAVDNPVQICSWITFGKIRASPLGEIIHKKPSNGTIHIVSSEGNQNITGPFYGQISIIDVPRIIYVIDYYCVGIRGFKGVQLGSYFFGFAESVDIGPETPDYKFLNFPSSCRFLKNQR